MLDNNKNSYMIIGLLTLQETTLLVSVAFCLAISKFAAVTVPTPNTVTFAAVDTLGSLLAMFLRPRPKTSWWLRPYSIR